MSDDPGTARAADDDALGSLGPLLDRMEELLAEVEGLEDEATRDRVFELLDGVDALHRLGVHRLAAVLGDDVERLRRRDPAVDWLFQAYGVGVDDVQAADAALETIRPYLHEHGGEVEVLGVRQGVVEVRLVGACSGCTAASQTLQHGVEEALRENLPGFVAMDVAPDSGAPSHPPPGPVLVQISSRPA